MRHSNDNSENEIYKKWKLFMEIKNDIDKYINLLNNRRNNLFNEEEIVLKIENNNIIIISKNNQKLKEVMENYNMKKMKKNKFY